MQLKEKLPVYMLPRHILVLDRFPLNANGKYNRKALQLILEKNFGLRRIRSRIRSSTGDPVLNSGPSGNQQTGGQVAVFAP